MPHPRNQIHADTQLDHSSPFFVHPSDGPSSVSISPKLNGVNYHSQTRSMHQSLGGKLKLVFIDGTIDSIIDSLDPLCRAINKCNMLVHPWIINFVSKLIAQSIIFVENTIDVWINLKENFSQGDLVFISELMQEIYNVHQDSRTMMQLLEMLQLSQTGLGFWISLNHSWNQVW